MKMDLKCETILDCYTHKNRKIFCQIKVPTKNQKLKNTCRFLTSNQWDTFDRELEKLLDDMKSSEDEEGENFGKFIIRPNIEVKVQRSNLSLKYFCKCLFPTSGDSEKEIWEKTEDIAFALECILDFQHEAIYVSSKEIQEYEPQIKTLSPDGKLPTSLTYEPYTPSKTKYCSDDRSTIKTPGIELLTYNEDTYSPRPLFEIGAIQILNEIIPEYKPAPITQNKKSKDDSNYNIVDTDDGVFAQKTKEEYIPEARKKYKMPLYVPTPINESLTQKASFHNKMLRRRSKTIDAMPKDLPLSIFNNQKSDIFGGESLETLNENGSKSMSTRIRETRSPRDSDNSLNNEVVIETEDETVPLRNCRSLRFKSKKQVRNEKEINSKSNDKEINSKSKTQEQFAQEERQPDISIENYIIKTNELNKEIHELHETLPYNYKNNMKKRSKTIDLIPKELAKENEQLLINRIFEKDKKRAKSSDYNTSDQIKEKKNESNKICKDIKEEGISDEKPTKVLRSTSTSEDENYSTHSKRLKNQAETPSKENVNDFENVKNVSKNKNLNASSSSSPELSTSDASPTKSTRKTKKKEQSPSTNITSLRRSDRSPSKPKRFMEEINIVDKNHHKKTKKIKTSTKNKELFGTDDDDDDEIFDNKSDSNNDAKKAKTLKTAFETPTGKNSTKYFSLSSSSSTAKKKRKTDKDSDCEQEKRDISKWLSKTKTSSLEPEASTSKVSKKSARSKSPLTKLFKTSKNSKKSTDSKEVVSESVTSTFENFDMPSMKELEEMQNKTKLKQKENEILKAELDKIRVPPPKEVKNLSLQDMSLNDVLGTFSKFKNELDEIYKKNCKKDYIKTHDGINHCFVIQLLQPNVQMKMLEKLTDVYSNSTNRLQTTLYANALLPEWIIRVYMEKFKFSREEAITQIKAQDDYRLYVEEQNDGSFIFN